MPGGFVPHLHESSATADGVAFFREQGYLIVPNLVLDEEIARFLAAQKSDGPKGHEQTSLVRHRTEPSWAALAEHPRAVSHLSILIGGRPRVVQTMYLPKAPARPGVVPRNGVRLHQDRHYIPTQPHTLMAAWIALNDADADNGGLMVVPASHTLRLREGTVCDPSGSGRHTVEHRMRAPDGREWTETVAPADFSDLEDRIITLTVPRGAVVFFHGKLVHGSAENSSPIRERLAFATHYVCEKTWVFRTDLADANSAW
jgi:ectoine hydroxylase-related dioxygenase (phytanoyl-CoA dioxygenase family)